MGLSYPEELVHPKDSEVFEVEDGLRDGFLEVKHRGLGEGRDLVEEDWSSERTENEEQGERLNRF